MRGEAPELGVWDKLVSQDGFRPLVGGFMDGRSRRFHIA